MILDQHFVDVLWSDAAERLIDQEKNFEVDTARYREPVQTLKDRSDMLSSGSYGINPIVHSAVLVVLIVVHS